MEFNGTVKRVELLDVRKDDEETQQGKIVIENDDGYKVIVTGDESLAKQYSPNEKLTVKVTATNKKLSEVTGKSDS